MGMIVKKKCRAKNFLTDEKRFLKKLTPYKNNY